MEIVGSMSRHVKRSISGHSRGSYAFLSDQVGTDTAIVFVHGFFGDARGTWLNFPGLVDSNESFWPGADLFFLDYPSYQHHVADNSDLLLRFLEEVFPSPPSSLFQPRRIEPRSSLLVSLALQWEQLNPRVYRKLILVGHSEGALVIRQAIIDLCQRTDGLHQNLNARLALFAPAHRGVLATGWLKAILEVARAEELVQMSPAVVEMQDAEFINGVQQSTSTLLAQYGRDAFRAMVLFGCDENLVRVQVFPRDKREECAAQQSHVSVCKPRHDYTTPFVFIESAAAWAHE
jgi:pimeloyl-ACP methyl ester carboxylesterase